MAVSALQPLCYHWMDLYWRLPERKTIMPSRRPIAKGRARADLTPGRHGTCFAYASNQRASALLSPSIYIIPDGAVEPENVVSDVTTPFSHTRAAIPPSLSAST